MLLVKMAKASRASTRGFWSMTASMAPNIQTPRVDPEEQRRLAEIEAARQAKLFTDSRGERTAGNPQVASTTAATATGSGIDSATGLALAAETPPLDSGSAQNMQDRKLAFVNADNDHRTVSADRVREKASPYIVQAGTVIAAALITGIKSDLPGQIIAQVTEHVYDSPTGSHLLIPQGSRLIGQYDSQVAFGQSRVLLVWNRLIMPDGTSIVLERLQGLIRKATPVWRMASITIGANCSGPRPSRRCLISARKSVPAMTRPRLPRRSAKARRIPHPTSASRSCDAGSTSSRRSPSGRASWCA